MASPVLLGSVLRSQSRAEQAYSWGDHALEGYLLNVVEDTTPQLGGNLDVNGFSIVSASNGDITVEPHGTGVVVLPKQLSLGEDLADDGSGFHVKLTDSDWTSQAFIIDDASASDYIADISFGDVANNWYSGIAAKGGTATGAKQLILWTATAQWNIHGTAAQIGTNGNLLVNSGATGAATMWANGPDAVVHILGEGGAVSGGWQPGADSHQLFLENSGDYCQIAMLSDSDYGTFIATKQAAAGTQVYSGWWGSTSGYQQNNYVVTSLNDWVFIRSGAVKHRLDADGSVFLRERASAGTDVAAYGQLWIKNNTPNELWFSDDAGTDTEMARIFTQEGTFTPELRVNSSAVGITQTNSGYYTVIGNMCFVSLRIVLSNKGGVAGNVTIHNLPHASATATDLVNQGSVGFSSGLAITAGESLTCRILSGVDYMQLWHWNATTGTSRVTDAEITNSAHIQLSIAYPIA